MKPEQEKQLAEIDELLPLAIYKRGDSVIDDIRFLRSLLDSQFIDMDRIEQVLVTEYQWWNFLKDTGAKSDMNLRHNQIERIATALKIPLGEKL